MNRQMFVTAEIDYRIPTKKPGRRSCEMQAALDKVLAKLEGGGAEILAVGNHEASP